MLLTICASMKFKQAIFDAAKKLDEKGIEYILPITDVDQELKKDNYAMLKFLTYDHIEKINKADSILVVNPTGYIGDSVKLEIAYAKGAGKKIYFLKETGLHEYDCLADVFVGENLDF